MATNLFAMPGAVGGGSGPKPLVEFKAGKMVMSSNNKVTPDKRKGLVQLLQSPDGLLHFIWKDRTTGSTEDDLIIFPEDAVFKKVKQVESRVYMLEFKASLRKLFFWMQEGKDDKDEEHLTKINQYINNPPAPEQGGGGMGGMGGGMGGMMGGLGGMMGGLPPGIDQNTLMSMFAPPPASTSSSSTTTTPSTATPTTPSSSSSTSSGSPSPARGNPNVGLGDLQSILSGMGIPTSAVSGLMNAQQQQQRQRQQGQQPSTTTTTTTSSGTQQEQRGPSLSQVMSPDVLMPLLANPTIQNQLLPFLPEERRTPEEIREVIRSPQFQQSLDHFSQALATGQLTEMLRQFGIDTTQGAPTTVEQLLQAIQNSSATQSSSNTNTTTNNNNNNPPSSGGSGGEKKDGMDTS